MLKVTYENFEILPHDNELGADCPFDIKLFTKWNSPSTFASLILQAASFVSLFFVSMFFLLYYKIYDNELHQFCISFLVSSVSILMQRVVYRNILLEEHESFYLLFIKKLSKFLRLKLKDDFEYVIYRAKLSVVEHERIGIAFEDYHKILIHIEDREFLKHYGVSFKRTVRAILGLIPFISRSGGGSSITQQLMRTLFVVEYSKTYRRKLIEILLAFWGNHQFSKAKQLNMYLSAVRFEKDVIGINGALNFFFGKPLTPPSKAQIFFLVERIANSRSLLLKDKVISKIRSLKIAKLISDTDIAEISELYVRMCDDRKVAADFETISNFQDECRLLIQEN